MPLNNILSKFSINLPLHKSFDFVEMIYDLCRYYMKTKTKNVVFLSLTELIQLDFMLQFHFICIICKCLSSMKYRSNLYYAMGTVATSVICPNIYIIAIYFYFEKNKSQKLLLYIISNRMGSKQKTVCKKI